MFPVSKPYLHHLDTFLKNNGMYMLVEPRRDYDCKGLSPRERTNLLYP